ELDVGVRLRERMGHGLVRADRLAELDARLRVLDAEVERALRHAERLRRARGTKARSLTGGPSSLDTPKRARRVDRGDVALAVEDQPQRLQLAGDVGEGDMNEVRARVARITELLQQQRLLDEAEPGLGAV